MKLLKIDKNKLNFKTVGNSLALFWNKTYVFFVSLFFVILVGYGVFIWYESLYGGIWSFDKKQQYLNSQEKSVSFKEKEFNKALEDIAQRKTYFEKEYQPIRDVFIPYEGGDKVLQ